MTDNLSDITMEALPATLENGDTHAPISSHLSLPWAGSNVFCIIQSLCMVALGSDSLLYYIPSRFACFKLQ